MDPVTLLWLAGIGAAIPTAILTIARLRRRGQRGQRPRRHPAPVLIGRDTWGAAAQAEMNYLAGIEPDDDRLPSPPQPAHGPGAPGQASSDAASDAPAEPGLILQPQEPAPRQRPQNAVQAHPPVAGASSSSSSSSSSSIILPADLQDVTGVNRYRLEVLRTRWSVEGRAAHE